MTTSLRRTLLITAAILPLSAAFASAQYRVDNNASRDANNRVGSGGFNDNTGATRLGGLAGNYIVTGNVTGGRAFRGNLGYTDASQFRGAVGSNDFDNFVRDSAGVGDLRGTAYNGLNTNQAPQPFFGNRTAAAPVGFVRSPSDNGTFVQRTGTQVIPNDGRADFGGANHSDVVQTLINSQQRYGNAGIPPTAATPFGGAAFDPYSPLQLSEYTSLARSRRDLYANNDVTNPLTGAINPQDNSITGLAGNANNAGDPSTLVPDNRLDSSGVIQAQPDATAAPGDTGQSLSARSNRAIDNNPQYAKLRDRLAQVRGDQTPGSGQIDNRLPGSSPMGGPGLSASGAVSTGQGTQLTKATPTPSKEGATDNPAAPADGTKPKDGVNDAPGNPVTPKDTTPGMKLPAAADPTPNTAADNLQLPRPEGTGKHAVKHDVPVEITSLAAGVKDAKLAKILTDAEGMMKSGKFGSAIDTYERAEEIASDDPLVFMGRSIAELGGGYYRNAEIHLRQAFAADDSLLYAKFDLRSMIGDDRLNTLATNLSDIAGKNEKDAGPLLLLAFIYYNGGMEDKAARALDMAQVRAGGKDHDVDALRKNWSFEATPPAGDLNK